VKSRDRQKDKMKRLLQEKDKKEKLKEEISPEQMKRWVINLSHVDLSKAQTNVLARGLNFAISPTAIPTKDFVVATEKACRSLSTSEAEDLRNTVAGILRTAKQPKSNIPLEERKALLELKRDPSVMVLPADKGRATVVMDKSEYEEKVLAMLGEEKTYEKLKKDPTPIYKRKLVAILSRLKEEEKISSELHAHLYPTSEKVPQLYCLPKIHKKGVPFRPIVDYTGSIGYNTSRYLADILSPLVGKTEQFVKNSKHLAGTLGDFKLLEDEMLISHDVVSLFTNTLVTESLKIIKERLEQVSDWRTTTSLEVDDVMELLEFVLTTTYFSFRGQIYRQKFGTAMGSPVSPLVANMFMEHLEQKLLATVPEEMKPRLWKRYVDDILEVVKKGKVEVLTEFMNGLDESGSIQFTYETETDGKLPFLDLQLVRKEDNSLKLQIYRKPTHTDQYLNFTSHHPIEHKLSVVRTLLDRSRSLVSETIDKEEEEKHVEKALMSCGNPKWTFKKVKSQMNSEKIKTKEKKNREPEKRPLVVLLYVERVSETVARVFRKHNVPVAMRPVNTLKKFLVHPKDKQDKEETTECVYRIPCGNCDKTYVGETGRKFGVRMKEHKAEVESKSGRIFTRSQHAANLEVRNKSALTDHAAQQNHVINWSESKILDKEPDRGTRWIKEAICIRKEGQRAMNRDEGSYTLSHVYDKILATSTSDPYKKQKKN